jgi:hypothetical protein
MNYHAVENMTLKETGPRKTVVTFDIHEDQIKGLLRAQLVKEGFPDASITVKLGKDHGPDIEAPFPDGQGRIFIAVKGEPAPTLQQGTKKGEKKATGRVATQRRHWLWENLGEAVHNMKHGEGNAFVLAFPSTFETLVLRCFSAIARRKLLIPVLFIQSDHTIKVLEPSEEQISPLNSLMNVVRKLRETSM